MLSSTRRLLPISQRDFVRVICYGGRAEGGCRGETAVLLNTMCCTIPLVILVESWSKELLQGLCFDTLLGGREPCGSSFRWRVSDTSVR